MVRAESRSGRAEKTAAREKTDGYRPSVENQVGSSSIRNCPASGIAHVVTFFRWQGAIQHPGHRLRAAPSRRRARAIWPGRSTR
jgi:hypothetical protein